MRTVSPDEQSAEENRRAVDGPRRCVHLAQIRPADRVLVRADGVQRPRRFALAVEVFPQDRADEDRLKDEQKRRDGPGEDRLPLRTAGFDLAGNGIIHNG